MIVDRAKIDMLTSNLVKTRSRGLLSENASRAMITGYNTDVEHGGVVYHVQTEDKGLQNPIILSLVYAGGEILASKRSPYQDLIQNGFMQAALPERLQRQHNLICASIHACRVEELRKTSNPVVTGAKPLEANEPGPAPTHVNVC